MNTSDSQKNMRDDQHIFTVDADYIRIFCPELLNERDKQMQDSRESSENDS
jgi:hypothetical protein